jgi:hypothetical protein
LGNEQGTYDRRRSVRCGYVLRLGGPRCFHCLLDGVWEMTLRQFLQINFGFDIYEWEENEIRF